MYTNDADGRMASIDCLPEKEDLDKIGCRLPGDIQYPVDFWKLIMEKGTGRTPKVPESCFNINAYLYPDNKRPGSFNIPGGYFLNSSLQESNPIMFNISPTEAMWMIPQQQMLLEVVYKALEAGGVTLGVIIGSSTACFMSFKEPDLRHSYAATGVDPGLISNRISHVFNLKGPSITVNTACSSSVYALHNACNALCNKEYSTAVHINTAKLGVPFLTSTCHTFDIALNGYNCADAVGVVYLKRLSDAIEDDDCSNGKVPGVGITHPNLEGQERVIRHAYQRGGNLDPNLTSYFECHGTGSPISDPLEVHAVAKAMNETRAPDE
ncbi:beta-ketoacyl [acyl carrier protein] synthase domain-containing protein [Aspergillus homomorphus CBS 101889]|uniref:Thiolase-like protein n=1 Tax=Aspergillus homomorphus (strain CBS 101889) TaxID=1450537 RepID=A0A395I762_ASPHC|nr:thiolase-like protein [Aspergillus homomorphus CBS 101889]RAL14074.1 thiolase-like protein [Aspergillus homomorphus CBS 101889]